MIQYILVILLIPCWWDICAIKLYEQIRNSLDIFCKSIIVIQKKMFIECDISELLSMTEMIIATPTIIIVTPLITSEYRIEMSIKDVEMLIYLYHSICKIF